MLTKEDLVKTIVNLKKELERDEYNKKQLAYDIDTKKRTVGKLEQKLMDEMLGEGVVNEQIGDRSVSVLSKQSVQLKEGKAEEDVPHEYITVKTTKALDKIAIKAILQSENVNTAVTEKIRDCCELKTSNSLRLTLIKEK